jgi:hypothetical protein
MARTYRALVRLATRGVRTLAAGLGEAFVGVLHGVMSDLIAQGATEAIKSAWLTNPEQPDDALTLIGAERKLPGYPGETPTIYRSRLSRAWDDYQVAGDEDSIIGQLAAAGFPGAQIYDPWSASFLPAPYWSHFIVRFPIGSHPVTGPGQAWGSFTWGDGTLYGPTGITPQQIALIRAIIAKWKPARWICRRIDFQISGWAYGTGHLWGETGLLWGGDVVSIGP